MALTRVNPKLVKNLVTDLGGKAALDGAGLLNAAQSPKRKYSVDSASPITGLEPTEVQTAYGPCVEFAKSGIQGVIFTYPWMQARAFGMEVRVAASVANAGTFVLEIGYRINGGALTTSKFNVTPGSNTNLSWSDLGQIIAAGSLSGNDMLTITIKRLPADVSDTHTGNLQLYTTVLKEV